MKILPGNFDHILVTPLADLTLLDILGFGALLFVAAIVIIPVLAFMWRNS